MCAGRGESPVCGGVSGGSVCWQRGVTRCEWGVCAGRGESPVCGG